MVKYVSHKVHHFDHIWLKYIKHVYGVVHPSPVSLSRTFFIVSKPIALSPGVLVYTRVLWFWEIARWSGESRVEIPKSYSLAAESFTGHWLRAGGSLLRGGSSERLSHSHDSSLQPPGFSSSLLTYYFL